MRKKKNAPPSDSALPPLTARQREFLAGLCDRHYAGLFKYACTLIPAQEAEELMQDLFLLAARKIDKLMESPCPDGWLAKALVFLVKNRYDRKLVRQKYDAGPLENNELLPAPDKTEDVDTELSLQTALSPRDYGLYRMIYYEGYTMTEAAERLGVTPEAVWKRMERLRKRLREHYQE